MFTNCMLCCGCHCEVSAQSALSVWESERQICSTFPDCELRERHFYYTVEISMATMLVLSIPRECRGCVRGSNDSETAQCAKSAQWRSLIKCVSD